FTGGFAIESGIAACLGACVWVWELVNKGTGHKTRVVLRRHRQIRMQIHQLMDAAIFAFSFWAAYVLRANPEIIRLFHLEPVGAFESTEGVSGVSYSWLILIPTFFGPLILEAQGFYNRPALCGRGTTVWQLFRGCVFATLVLVAAMFLLRIQVARSA